MAGYYGGRLGNGNPGITASHVAIQISLTAR